MPIRPEMRGRYPAEWPAVRAAIMERAGDRCEWCGVPQYAVGYRDGAGEFVPGRGNGPWDAAGRGLAWPSLEPLTYAEAKEFAEKLEGEGLKPVRRWKYMVVGAADEDAANELADRIRAEAPADSKVTAEGSLAVAWRERPPSPFFWLGGLGDG